MAGKIVGITIDIAGKTSGLVSSLKDADSALTKTNSALKSVNSALKFDGNNVDLLTSKSQLLGEAIAQNSNKLDVLKATAEKAMETLGQEGGTTTEQMAELQAEISRTEQTLAGLQTEAENTNSALQDLSGDAPEEMEGLADASEETADSLQDVDEESGNTSAGLEALAGVAAATGAAMAAAFSAAVAAAKEVGEALVNCTVDAAAYADELLTTSQITGLSTDTLQELAYAAELVDVSTETIEASMRKNLKAMDSAREGTGAAAEAYAALGVSVTDAEGNLRDQETVFWEVIDALGNVSSEEERTLLSMDLLGRSAADLAPLINAGSETMAQLAEEAHNTGYVLDSETLESFGAFDDQLQRLNNGVTGAKNALGTVLLPTLSGLAGTGTDLLNKFTVKVKESDGDIGKIGEAVEELLPELFAGINEHMPEIFGLIGTVTETLAQIIIDNLPMLLDSALQIITTLTDGLLAPDNITKIVTAALDIVLKLTEYLIANVGTIMQAAIQIIVAIVNGLAQATPQLIPAIVEAVLTIIDTLIDNLPLLLDAGMQLLMGVCTGLLDALPDLIERLPEIISGIIDFLLSEEGIGKLVTTGFDLFVAIVEDMPNIIAKILEAVAGLIGDIVGKIVGLGGDVLDACKEMFPSFDDVAKWGKDMIDGIIDGITGALGDLWDTCSSVASGIADFLGFSVPKKGPLAEWGINNPGADMVELYSEGINSELPDLQNSIDLMAGTISTGAVPAGPDYTGQLASISGSISGIAAASDRPIVVNAYMGTEYFGTMVANANSQNAYIAGGR